MPHHLPSQRRRLRRRLFFALFCAISTAATAAAICALRADQRCPVLLHNISAWAEWPAPALEGWLLIGAAAAVLITCAVACCAAGDPDAAELDRASWLSRISFWWVTPTLQTAKREGTLELPDLPRLAATDEPRGLMERLARAWPADGRPRLGAYRLLRSILFSTQRAVFAQAFLAGWAFCGCMLADPIILRQLLTSRQDAHAGWAGVARDLVRLRDHSRLLDGRAGVSMSAGGRVCSQALVLLLAVSMLIRVTCMEVCYFSSVRVSSNARSQLIVSLFRSAVDGSASGTATSAAEGAAAEGAAHEKSAGELVTLMASDADKIGAAEWLTWGLSQWCTSRSRFT
jgi:hypothetical protein